MIKKIISGLQSGADEAAADVAIFLGIDQNGHVPYGAFNERGKIVGPYKYIETNSKKYELRTYLNVKCSDATIIFSYGRPTGGTYLTIKYCDEAAKPYLYIDLFKYKNEKEILKWLKEVQPSTLNVAGSRESKHPGIYRAVRFILTEVLMKFNGIKE